MSYLNKKLKVVIPVTVTISYCYKKNHKDSTITNAIYKAKEELRNSMHTSVFCYTGSFTNKVIHIGRAKKVV